MLGWRTLYSFFGLNDNPDPWTLKFFLQCDCAPRRITFEKHGVREMETAPRASAADESVIGHTYLPGHLANNPEHAARAAKPPPLGAPLTCSLREVRAPPLPGARCVGPALAVPLCRPHAMSPAWP